MRVQLSAGSPNRSRRVIDYTKLFLMALLRFECHGRFKRAHFARYRNAKSAENPVDFFRVHSRNRCNRCTLDSGVISPLFFFRRSSSCSGQWPIKQCPFSAAISVVACAAIERNLFVLPASNRPVGSRQVFTARAHCSRGRGALFVRWRDAVSLRAEQMPGRL